ncbi:hypothetical protein FZEAL_9147 [Fusarium zealandicum]|uniref:Uncharacterized protein n=1 Tax=Fusarium zealandicum TaxID=1053134 RepID=A0A8H4UCK4_9HYPO|nr:hypothetical protein FZEAL_9147 [Fusarium zealandicum]
MNYQSHHLLATACATKQRLTPVQVRVAIYIARKYHPLTAIMDRPTDSRYNRTESSRQWSDEAVRGSWDSSYQRASAAPSPRDQTSSWRGASPNSYDRTQTRVSQWLGQQYTQDPSRAVDAVTNLTTPTTSPAISDSASFPSRTTGDSYQTHAVSNDFMAPPPRTSVPHRQYDHGSSSYSREPTSRAVDYRPVEYRPMEPRSTEQDLRGVGAFADTDSSRRRVKYTPLSNWFGLWLPPHD